MNFKTYKSILTFIVLLVPIGLGTKFYCGDNYFWVNNSLSDILYEIFWSLLLYFIYPKLSSIKNVMIIFFITVLIEFSQLLSTPLLNEIRSTFLGKTLLGTTFVAMDFVYYMIGCIISLIIMLIHRQSIN